MCLSVLAVSRSRCSVLLRFTVLALAADVSCLALSFENSLPDGMAVRIDLAVPGALPDIEEISDLLLPATLIALTTGLVCLRGV